MSETEERPEAISDALHNGPDDPLGPARARGAAIRQRLVEDSGGLLELDAIARRLGVSPEVVTSMRRQGEILGVPLDYRWTYPACQLDDQGLVPGLRHVLSAFQDASVWSQFAILVAPSKRFGGRSALWLLRAGDVESARAIATGYGKQG